MQPKIRDQNIINEAGALTDYRKVEKTKIYRNKKTGLIEIEKAVARSFIEDSTSSWSDKYFKNRTTFTRE